MPSLHAADALIVGSSSSRTCRTLWAKALWALWPLWVWFCVIATANHYLLDVLAGIVVALLPARHVAWFRGSSHGFARPARYRKPAIVAP